jgi:NAD(P)-dependent dehydrogenase (short-subunit alcohol dehydrogenase family)
MVKDTVLVTGAGRGIGLAIAREMGKQCFHVAIIDSDREAAQKAADLVRADGGVAAAVPLDITRLEDHEAAVSEISRILGAPSIIINNAAVGGGEAFAHVTPERFDAVMDVSVRASFFLTQALIPHMKERKWGRIVNISSLIAARGSPGNPHYAAAKAAMVGMSRCWAMELAPFGITANTVFPAFTDTAMTRSTFSDEYLEERSKMALAGRLATAEDCARLVVFLCSRQADFISGQAISPNGAEFVGAM